MNHDITKEKGGAFGCTRQRVADALAAYKEKNNEEHR